MLTIAEFAERIVREQQIPPRQFDEAELWAAAKATDFRIDERYWFAGIMGGVAVVLVFFGHGNYRWFGVLLFIGLAVGIVVWARLVVQRWGDCIRHGLFADAEVRSVDPMPDGTVQCVWHIQHRLGSFDEQQFLRPMEIPPMEQGDAVRLLVSPDKRETFFLAEHPPLVLPADAGTWRVWREESGWFPESVELSDTTIDGH